MELRHVSALALCSILAGCTAWESRETANAVGSDDDSRVLVSIRRWEEREVGGGDFHSTPRRNVTSEVRLYHPNGALDRVLLPETGGLYRRGLTLSMRGGYAIVSEAVPGEHGELYQRVALDSGTIATAGTFPPGEPLPSPDGTLVATLVLGDCPTRPLGTCDFTVELTDPHTLEALGRPLSAEMPSTDGVWLFWHPAGHLVAHDRRNDAAVALYLDGTVEHDVPVPTCYEPRTASSEWSSGGTRVDVDVAGSEVSLRFEDDGEGYPERCFDWP